MRASTYVFEGVTRIVADNVCFSTANTRDKFDKKFLKYYAFFPLHG